MSSSRYVRYVRAATTVEYAIIIVAVMLLGAGSFKLLGGSVGSKSGSAGATITDEGNGEGKGKAAQSSSGGGGKSGAGGGGPSSKVKVGGVGGGGETPNPDQAGRSRDTSSDQGPGGPVGAVSNVADKGGTDVADNFGAKRWMGIGLLVCGVIAILYVLLSVRRAKQGGDAVAGDGKGGGGKPAKRSI